MKIKRFAAKNMRQAMQQIRNEFGGDAVILSNKSSAEGVELVAAMDFDERNIQQQFKNQPKAISQVTNHEVGGVPENVSWINENAISKMQTEINALRNLLEDQLAGLAWHEKQRTKPTQAVLLRRLHKLGFANNLCKLIVNDISITNIDEAWQLCLEKLKAMLPVGQDDLLTTGGIIAFVGPTGVGKTTTIAKLAARYTLQHGTRNIGLITTDSYRIAAHEQLATYGNILDVVVHHANNNADLQQALRRLRHKDLILIDTAGMGQRDKRLNDQIKTLSAANSEIKFMLVLSAISQFSAADEVILNFRKQTMHGCIVTKLDEASLLGEVLSVLIKHQLPISYITNGQNVPEDILIADKGEIIKQAISLVHTHDQSNAQNVADEDLAMAFGDISDANE